jgi:transposase
MARARGYKGSYRRLRAAVALLRPPKPRETFVHITTLIGQQAQVDWAHVGEQTKDGVRRDLWVFVMTLAWSRAILLCSRSTG